MQRILVIVKRAIKYNDERQMRERWLDVSRGIGILLVVVGHSNPPIIVRHLIYGFHMPFFLLLSGFLYNNEKWTKVSCRAFIKSRWNAYIIPYFICCGVNLLINIPLEYGAGLEGKELLISTVKHAFWCLYSYGEMGRMPNCSPLWFLPFLFVSEMMFFFLMKLKYEYKRTIICIVALSVLLLMKYLPVPSQVPWHFDIALLGMVFLYIGYQIKEKKMVIFIRGGVHSYVILLSLLIVGSYSVLTNEIINICIRELGNIVLLITASICFFCFVLYISRNIIVKNSLLELLGRETIIILSFNYAINTVLSTLYNNLLLLLGFHLENNSISWWLLSLAGTVVLTTIIMMLRIVKCWYRKELK